MLKIKSKYSVAAVSLQCNTNDLVLPAKRGGKQSQSRKRWIYLFFIIAVFFISTLEAADTKNFESRIKELENENSRLRQQLAMEEEASKLLGQKLLKAYEEKVVIENEFKEAKNKIKNLEGESAGVRKLMENEVLGYRKKLGAVQEELGNLKKRIALLSNENKVKAYLEELEKENMVLKEKLSRREEDIARNLSEINKLKEELKAGMEMSIPQIEGKVKEPEIAKEPGEMAKESGNILSVSKEFNFVIVEFNDPGEIAAGKIFSVFREDRKIGEVEVTKIREKYVFAKILNTAANEEIKKGDCIK